VTAGPRSSAAPGLHEIGPDDGVPRVVAALDQQVGPQRLEDSIRSRLVEDDHAIYCGEPGQHTRPILLRYPGPSRALAQAAGGGIAVDRHDQRGALGAGGLEVFNMTGMD
jgi:hypothetical protein